MITCKLTGKVGTAVKAHIIPRAFYEIPPQKVGPLMLMSNVSNTFPKKLPAGIYDSTIVTKEGESLFNPWDDYAIRILLNESHELNQIKNRGKVYGSYLADYDYLKLKLFALSVIWRAHASSDPAFSKVNLGTHEDAIRNMLLNCQPGDPEQYSVHIVRWLDDDFGPVFMDPFQEKYEGVNYYRLYCGRYVFYIKIDRRKTISSFRELQLSPRNRLFLIARDLKKSKEWSVMMKIAKAKLR